MSERIFCVDTLIYAAYKMGLLKGLLMADTTKIEWCDSTINWWEGCTAVSPACDLCYARTFVEVRFGRAIFGGPGKGIGTRRRTSEALWKNPYRWERQAAATGARPFIFSSSHSDVFDNHPAVTEWRNEAFEVMRETPHLIYLMLTKRPQNIEKMVAATGKPLPRNVALGTSAGTQAEYERNGALLTRAKARLDPQFVFISMEPMLGPVDLTRLPSVAKLDWIIVGGETGHGARHMKLEWARAVRDQCRELGPLFNFKQTGTAPAPGAVGKLQPNGHTLDGVQHFGRPPVRAIGA
jgi:protein gp37